MLGANLQFRVNSVILVAIYIEIFPVVFESAIVEVSTLDCTPDILFRVHTRSREAGSGHVSWLISRQQSWEATCAMFDGPVVERLGLVELLAVLGPHLVGMHVFLGVPAGGVP